MKKILLAVTAVPGVILAQKQDTVKKYRVLEEVRIDSRRFMNKTSEDIAKIPLKNIENPQVYSSISNVILKKQIAMNMEDAMKNATGITKLWDATGRPDGGSYFTSRGFPTTTKIRNGLVTVANDNVDMGNVERIEVIKGPSATLFGSFATSYGGLINKVTKKPFFDLKGEAEISGGGYNFYRGAVDVNVPLNRAKTVAARLNLSGKNQDSWQDQGYMKNYNFAPSVLFKPNDRFSLTVDAEIMGNKGNSSGGNFMFFMSPGTINRGLTAALGSFGLPQASVNALMAMAPQTYELAFGTNKVKDLNLDYNRSFNNNDVVIKNTSNSFFADAQYKIDEHWKSQTNFVYAQNSSNGYLSFQYLLPNYFGSLVKSLLSRQRPSFGNPGYDDAARMLWRLSGKANTVNFQQNFSADHTFGNMRNRAVVGFDYTYYKNRYNYTYTTGLLYNAIPYPYVFDVVKTIGDDPNYHNLTLANVENNYATKPNSDLYRYNNDNLGGVYINDVLNISQYLILSAGVRYDYFKTNGTYNQKTQIFENPQHSSRWSPKFGLVVMPVKDQLSLFANYQNSFSYKYGVDANGVPFKPENANQFEAGAKISLLKDKLAGSISYYNILVKDLVRADESGNLFDNIQNGNQKSSGIEAEINGNLVPGWIFLIGYGYNDSKFEKANNDINGLRPMASGPKHTANFWTNYTFTNTALKGFGVGFSMNYSSESFAENSHHDGSMVLPAFIVLGSSFSYDAPRYRLALKINNITNERYWMGWTNMIPQMPRQVLGSIAYKF